MVPALRAQQGAQGGQQDLIEADCTKGYLLHERFLTD